MIAHGYLLEFSKIFDEKPKDFSTYLEGFSIDQIVLFCSHFLTAKLNSKEYKKPQDFINFWFSDSNNDFRNNIAKKISTLNVEFKENTTLIHIYNVLKLFEYAYNNLPAESTISNKDAEILLFKCILALNEEFNSRDKEIINSLSIANRENDYHILCLSNLFIQYDLIEYNIENVIVSQFIKSSLLFRFLEEYDDRTRALSSRLINDFKSDSWIDFLKRYLSIVHALWQSNKKGYLDIVINTDKETERNLEFMNNIAINDETNIFDLDFKQTRKKPFYKIASNRYRIISPLFSCEKIYEGQYFLLNEINEKLKKENSRYIEDDFRGFYCLHFSEEYLLYKILNISFPNKYIKHAGIDLKKDNTGEPDYYVRNGNKIFLFESKDILINAKSKQKTDFSIIENALREKLHFYYDKKGNRINIGIGQIINSIKNILLNKNTFDTVDKNTIRIYPIIITHHKTYNTPGLNHLINEWFSHELNELRKEGINTDNVNYLTIIDIDTFVLFHDLLRNRDIILEHLLDNYISISNFRKQANKKPSHYIESFYIFACDEISKSKKMKVPKLFIDLGLDLFKETNSCPR